MFPTGCIHLKKPMHNSKNALLYTIIIILCILTVILISCTALLFTYFKQDTSLDPQVVTNTITDISDTALEKYVKENYSVGYSVDNRTILIDTFTDKQVSVIYEVNFANGNMLEYQVDLLYNTETDVFSISQSYPVYLDTEKKDN